MRTGLQASQSDPADFETWAATGQPLSWPATEALVLKFMVHRLLGTRQSTRQRSLTWDARGRRESLRAEGLLHCEGPPMPRTR